MKSKIINNANKNKVIRRYCPSVETIEETYAGDEAMILQVCKELNCDRDEIIFTSLELQQLMKHIENDTPIKITMMDFTNTTFEEALCKITNQF